MRFSSAKTLLSSTSEDLAQLLADVKARLEKLGVPIAAVISDGQRSIRNAVATALPEAVHGLCHFHYLHEAAKPIYEADRHAKKELKKRVRGIRGKRALSQGNRQGNFCCGCRLLSGSALSPNPRRLSTPRNARIEVA